MNNMLGPKFYVMGNYLRDKYRKNRPKLIFYILHRNQVVPITQKLEDGIEVLDSDCGINASWVLEMSTSFPNSNFFGVDISDFDVAKLKMPINTRFSKGDVCKSISALDNTFDFVFQRLLIAAFTMINGIM